MNIKCFPLVVGLVLLLAASGCSTAPSEAATPPTPDPIGIDSPSGKSPEQVAETFYNWYIRYASPMAGRNPLADGAYRSNEYLSGGLVQKVDGIVASFDRGGFDPFLCAQDIPDRVSLDKAVVSGDVARVVVRTSFEGHAFTVALQQVESSWKMSDVLCEVEQAGVGDIPQAAHSAQQALAQQLNVGPEAVMLVSIEPVTWRDGCLEVHQAGQACIQVITPGYRVILESGAQRYEYRTDESGRIVRFTPDGSATIPGGAANWQTYTNGKYGFKMMYPAGWTYQEASNSPDHPPIGPANMKLIVMFMPQAWADEVNQGGPPDPNAPGVTPFALEVTEGALEDYQQTYVPAAKSDSLTLGNNAVVREEEILTDELSMIRYRFDSPYNPDLRLTFLDPISGFPARRQVNEDALKLFESMLPTLTFTQ